jgi:hypothetical protein
VEDIKFLLLNWWNSLFCNFLQIKFEGYGEYISESRRPSIWRPTLGLSVDESWITFADADILIMIKACFPQEIWGGGTFFKYVEKMKQSVHLLHQEKGSAQFIHRGISFCNLLPKDKAENVSLQEWIKTIWNKVPINMRIKD